jgi:hypothetical protein
VLAPSTRRFGALPVNTPASGARGRHVGTNVLSASGRTVTLQPLSVQGRCLNLAVGVAGLGLQPARNACRSRLRHGRRTGAANLRGWL